MADTEQRTFSDAEVMAGGDKPRVFSDADVMAHPPSGVPGIKGTGPTEPPSPVGEVAKGAVKGTGDFIGNLAAFGPLGPAVSAASYFDPELHDLGTRALKAAPGNAIRIAAGLYNAVRHFPETVTSVGKLADAALSQMTDPEMHAAVAQTSPDNQAAYNEALEAHRAENKPILDATLKGLEERYGSYSNLKHAIATEPLSIAMDMSMFLPMASPVNIAGKVARAGALDAALPGARLYTGFRTGAGADAIRLAGQSGREGGEAQATLARQLSGEGADMNEPVKLARSAFDKLDQTASDAYLAGLAKVGKSTETIDLGPVEAAIDKAKEVGSFKGVRFSEDVVNTENKITDLFNKWKDLDPADYHTALGLDALKKGVGEIRLKAQPGTKEWAVANKVYGAIKDQIVDQAPIYADTMLAYSTAQDTLEEIAKTFSLDKSNDMALRKLQSLMRDDVQSTYGGRKQLGQIFAEQEPMLPYALAGQVLHSPLPRGMLARGMGAVEGASQLATAVPTLGASLVPLAASSPRIVGETAQIAGRIARNVEPFTTPATNAANIASTPAYEANQVRVQAERRRLGLGNRGAEIGAAKNVDDAIGAAFRSINQ